MEKARKFLALSLIVVLALAVLGVAGCSSDEGTKTEETTEEATGIMSVDDLKSGDKVGVQSGTTGEAWAKENLVPKGVEVVPYNDVLGAFQALQAGDVVGVINDITISLDVAKDQTLGIEVVEEIVTDEGYGFAFNKENSALRDAINWGLQECVADGSYAEIYEKWLGEAPMSLPDASGFTKPAAELKLIVPGKIMVGSDTSFPPFENVEGDKIVGFDVDLATAIGEKLGVQVEFKTYNFDALVPAMKAGAEFDMIASGMTSTGDLGAERSQSVDFSEIYIWNNQSLTVKKAD
ncbi:MAG: transporter substrate-binding domain-containing protein [Actinomycetota bacterium]|nr:transporter substrate-binding domain-containing protein [Actinomycetota bacterium]